MNKIKTFIIFITLLVSCYTPQTMEISSITVLDSKFAKIRIISDITELKKINQLWNDFEPIDELPNTNWSYKLDIISNIRSGRWLYNEEGYIAKLNYQLKPKYRIKDPNGFKKALLDH